VISRHNLAPVALSALASGAGGTQAVAALRESRLSRHLLLIRFIADAWPGNLAERDSSLEVLARAQERAPEPVADLLGDPMVGAWAAWTARRIPSAPCACAATLRLHIAASRTTTPISSRLY